MGLMLLFVSSHHSQSHWTRQHLSLLSWIWLYFLSFFFWSVQSLTWLLFFFQLKWFCSYFQVLPFLSKEMLVKMLTGSTIYMYSDIVSLTSLLMNEHYTQHNRNVHHIEMPTRYKTRRSELLKLDSALYSSNNASFNRPCVKIILLLISDINSENLMHSMLISDKKLFVKVRN